GNLGYTDVSLTVERGVLAGRVWHQGRRFALRPSADGLLLGETTPGYWRLHPDEPHEPRPEAAAAANRPVTPAPEAADRGGWDYQCEAPLPGGQHVVDVLVLYT